MQFTLEEGERRDWFADPSIAIAAAMAIAGTIAFSLWELYGTRDPIVDLRILRYRTVAAGVVIAAGIAATLFGAVLVLPQFTQDVLGFTAYDSGLLLLFRALPVMLLAPLVAGLVGTGRLGVRITIAAGFALNAIGAWWTGTSTTTASGFGNFLPGLVLGGLGTAMLFIPLLIAVQTATTPEDAPKASSFITLAFQLGGSIASAVLVTTLDRRADFHLDILAGGITTRDLALQTTPSLPLQQLYALVVTQAQTNAFADVAYGVALIATLMIPLVFLLKHVRPSAAAGVSFE